MLAASLQRTVVAGVIIPTSEPGASEWKKGMMNDPNVKIFVSALNRCLSNLKTRLAVYCFTSIFSRSESEANKVRSLCI